MHKADLILSLHKKISSIIVKVSIYLIHLLTFSFIYRFTFVVFLNKITVLREFPYLTYLIRDRLLHWWCLILVDSFAMRTRLCFCLLTTIISYASKLFVKMKFRFICLTNIYMKNNNISIRYLELDTSW